jgi:hypothetical protein
MEISNVNFIHLLDLVMLQKIKIQKYISLDKTNCRRDFIDGNWECNFYTFIRPNHWEQLQKMQP